MCDWIPDDNVGVNSVLTYKYHLIIIYSQSDKVIDREVQIILKGIRPQHLFQWAGRLI